MPCSPSFHQFRNNHGVLCAQRQVIIKQFATIGFNSLTANCYPGGKVFDCFDTLFREAEKIDVGWYIPSDDLLSGSIIPSIQTPLCIIRHRNAGLLAITTIFLLEEHHV